MKDQSIGTGCVRSRPRIQRRKPAISFAKVGLLSIGVVFSLLPVPSFAGTAVTRVEAKLLWRDECPGATFYATESQAVQATIACYQASNPPAVTFYGDFACPGVQTTNGQAVYRCTHVRYKSPDPSSPDELRTTQSAYYAGVACPDGFTARGPTINGNTVAYCELAKTKLDPPAQGCHWVGNPIEPTSGIKKQTESDYRAPNGLLQFVRTYRSDVGQFTSAVSSSGFFDYSSTPSAPMGRCVSSRWSNTYAKDASGNVLQGSFCFPLTPIGTIDKPHALLWDEAGRQIDFDMSSGTPVPNADVNDRAVKTTDASGNVQWRLTRENNTIELYAANGALLSRTTADGKTVAYGYSTASTPATIAPASGLLIAQTDSFGRTLGFQYNSAGLMTQMTDPAGQVYTYTYDTTSPECAAGTCDRVVQVQFPDRYARQYLYNESGLVNGTTPPSPPLLTGISEVWPVTSSSAGQTVRASTFGYDSNGLSSLTQRAGGLDRYSVTNRSSGSVTIADPLGAQRTTAYQTLFGATYPSSKSQPAGSGCSASTTSWSYDSHGNATSTLDVNMNQTCATYDLSRNLETTRVQGLSKTATCSTYTATGAPLPRGSLKRSMQWHPDWRLEVKRAEPGTIVTSVYNGQADPFNANATASCAPSTALLPDGKPIAVLCKQVEQATTDTDGSQGFSATLQSAVSNRVKSWTYNAYGQVLTETDPLNNTAIYAYYSDTSFTGADPNAIGHTLGDLQSVTNAKGQVTRYTKYDKHGNVLESVDANGVMTIYTYDVRQRLLSASVGSQSTSYTYDASGQLLKVTAPDGSWLGYEYDAAHRWTAVTDNVGNRIEYVLDNAGNRTSQSVKDPNGALARRVTRVMDSLSRLQKLKVGAAQ